MNKINIVGCKHRCYCNKLHKVANREACYNINATIKIVPNFNNIISTKKSAVGFYKKSDNTIYLNNSIFKTINKKQQKAVILHEYAHLLFHQCNLIQVYTDDEEISADWYVCKWHCLDGLIEFRTKEYGQDYANALVQWEIIKTFEILMSSWHLGYIAFKKP